MMGVGILASVLGWNLTHQTPPPKVGAPAPAVLAPAARRCRRPLARLPPRQDRRAQLLRLLVRPMQAGGSRCSSRSGSAIAPTASWFWESTAADTKSDARRFLSAHGVTYPIVFDPGQTLALGPYALPGFPVTYVVNRQGRVVGSPVLGAGQRQRLQPGVRPRAEGGAEDVTRSAQDRRPGARARVRRGPARAPRLVGRPPAAGAGRRRDGARVHAAQARGAGQGLARLVPGKAGRAELLGVVVRTVQERGRRARA